MRFGDFLALPIFFFAKRWSLLPFLGMTTICLAKSADNPILTAAALDALRHFARWGAALRLGDLRGDLRALRPPDNFAIEDI